MMLAVGQAMADEAAGTVITTGEYRITIKGVWQPPPADNTDKTLVAVRVKDGKVIGMLMAYVLDGTVKKEANEMVESRNDAPGMVQLLAYEEFLTTAGIAGRRVDMRLRIEHPVLGSPVSFESIYLPQTDDRAVTFKGMCALADVGLVGPEFRAIMRDAVRRGQ
jgi:hypothetical protein